VTDFVQPHIDWAALAPELALLGGSGTVMLGVMFTPAGWRRRLAIGVSLLALLGAAAAALTLLALDRAPSGVVADALRRDHLAEIAQVVLCGVGVLGVLVSIRERSSDRHLGEFYALLLASVGGMAFFVAAGNLMTLFLGLEWFSICLYVMCALATDRRESLEAGLKYLVIGSFGSAILLLGSAFVYGATGAIQFDEIAAAADPSRALLVTGLAMILVGLAFKVSAAPFHQWTPDVYEGAPTTTTAFMAAATKVAAFVLAIRVLTTAFPGDAELWTIALGVVATASLAWGNLAALVQRNVKRILAYSSVSHAGFLLMPVAAGNELGGRALVFYLIPYAAMSIGAFAVVAARERELGRGVDVEDLAGLGWERPLHGAAMATFALGFIGLPPTGLFVGKFYAFSALYERGWIWLMVVGAVFTAVSVYYYVGILRAMYMRGPRLTVAPAGGSPPVDRPLAVAIVASLVIAVGTFVGVDPLIDAIRDAVAVLPYPY
jgi:NADH-quinone oxidoreductase subunit N